MPLVFFCLDFAFANQTLKNTTEGVWCVRFSFCFWMLFIYESPVFLTSAPTGHGPQEKLTVFNGMSPSSGATLALVRRLQQQASGLVA